MRRVFAVEEILEEPPPKPDFTRAYYLDAPGDWTRTPANEALKTLLAMVQEDQEAMVAGNGDIALYRYKRNFPGPDKYGRASFANQSIIFPRHPIRISPPENFVVPVNVNLIFPPGAQIELDELDGSFKDDVLFTLQGDEPESPFVTRRRIIQGPVIKAPNLDITCFDFTGNQTNTRFINGGHLYGFHEAIHFHAWHNDTSISGDLFMELCSVGIGGAGGQNCRISGNRFLTCGNAIELANAQDLVIQNNIFSQKNSITLPEGAGTAMTLQGRNVLVTENHVQDHPQVLVGNLYNGLVRGNAISYTGELTHLRDGFLADLRTYGPLGGTDFKNQLGTPMRTVISGNVFSCDKSIGPWPMEPVKRHPYVILELGN